MTNGGQDQRGVAGIRLPYGVEIAGRERAILAEQQFAEMAVVGEAVCQHDDLARLRVVDSAFDDHATIYGECRSCGLWVVRTEYRTQAEDETRPMNAREIAAMEAYEGRRRMSEAS